MAKVDASVVKAAYDRVARAKAAMYEARKALELTAELPISPGRRKGTGAV